MLVLSRKTNETIHIRDDIELTVLAIQGKRVRLGITCPAEVRILRRELQDREGGAGETPISNNSSPQLGTAENREPAYVSCQSR